jgi:hypothetical protein
MTYKFLKLQKPGTDFLSIWKKEISDGVALFGVVVTLVEVYSFVILFHHIYKHNNHVAINILSPSVVQQRNRTNAVTLAGQFAGWVMEVW